MFKPEISIVLPVYNEEENLPVLIPQIIEVMQNLGRRYEVILIDDGSTDKSFEIINDLSKKYMEIRYIKFKNNAGQSAAFDAGFKAAMGDIIVTLDSDLQNDPKDIPKLISFIPQFDVVCGWRAGRKDSVMKKISSKIANRVRNFSVKDNIHDTGCSLKVYKKEWVDKIKLYDGMHRFLPALLSMEGANIKEVKVNHKPRQYGCSKYGIFNRLFVGIYDLLAVRWMQKRKLNYDISERS